jgi:hypothetical protein
VEYKANREAFAFISEPQPDLGNSQRSVLQIEILRQVFVVFTSASVCGCQRDRISLHRILQLKCLDKMQKYAAGWFMTHCVYFCGTLQRKSLFDAQSNETSGC